MNSLNRKLKSKINSRKLNQNIDYMIIMQIVLREFKKYAMHLISV